MDDDYIRQKDGSLRRAGTAAPTLEEEPSTFNLTDMGNAERLVRHFVERLRYCYEYKRWLIWTGKVWEWDEGGKIAALAKMAVRNIYHEAGNEPDDKKRKELADHAKHSESDHRINAMISLAQSEPGIPIKPCELDADSWLFNCLNGTVDLRTGELLRHRREDLLTIIVPVEYDPEARCPLWLGFLDRVTGSDKDLITYLQSAVGYSLTGNTRQQVIFLLYGLGNNGKSTFTMTIRMLVGPYGERLDADDLMLKDGKSGGGPKEGIASLRNKRYVVGSELQDGKRLDVSLVKDMTGGETVKARRLYEHDIEFMPTFKLWLYGNHKPVIADSTLSIWRRVKQIPFAVTIPQSEVDKELPAKLEAEMPGILAWAVRGCLHWQQYGLNEPEIVTTATASYRHEQDILGDFLEDCCILEDPATIYKADLKTEYQNWCQTNGIEPVTQRTFKTRLVEKGIGDGRSSDGKSRIWRGIRLRAATDVISDISDKTDPKSKLTDKNRQDFTKSPLMKEKQKDFIEKPVEDVSFVRNQDSEAGIPEGYPPYPAHKCRCGSDEFWPGPAGWLCCRCRPRGNDE
jgi:putative DNA primase/helicase